MRGDVNGAIHPLVLKKADSNKLSKILCEIPQSDELKKRIHNEWSVLNVRYSKEGSGWSGAKELKRRYDNI